MAPLLSNVIDTPPSSFDISEISGSKENSVATITSPSSGKEELDLFLLDIHKNNMAITTHPPSKYRALFDGEKELREDFPSRRFRRY